MNDKIGFNFINKIVDHIRNSIIFTTDPIELSEDNDRRIFYEHFLFSKELNIRDLPDDGNDDFLCLNIFIYDEFKKLKHVKDLELSPIEIAQHANVYFVYIILKYLKLHSSYIDSMLDRKRFLFKVHCFENTYLKFPDLPEINFGTERHLRLHDRGMINDIDDQFLKQIAIKVFMEGGDSHNKLQIAISTNLAILICNLNTIDIVID